ncbi:hypothetical protein C0Q70_01459 [Pomacea canaliculata]|uniref:ubiquitinyl hydrolase 1 n=1 Tax=Pomacea canaliculata TaxID=400727 RepID=A0A2T7PZI1_POMCA|nr:hypothetical protein C0Q70_01459 [Pomacea canaliculata]
MSPVVQRAAASLSVVLVEMCGLLLDSLSAFVTPVTPRRKALALRFFSAVTAPPAVSFSSSAVTAPPAVSFSSSAVTATPAVSFSSSAVTATPAVSFSSFSAVTALLRSRSAPRRSLLLLRSRSAPRRSLLLCGLVQLLGGHCSPAVSFSSSAVTATPAVSFSSSAVTATPAVSFSSSAVTAPPAVSFSSFSSGSAPLSFSSFYASLSHVTPLRNYFLQEENYSKIKRPPGDQAFLLVQRFGELIRKLWNPRNFKAHVSPHEMLQAVVLCSKKRFQITQQGDAIDFLSWFLNAMHSALNGTRKLSSSIISQTFRGKMLVFSRKIPPIDLPEQEKEKLLQTEEYQTLTEEIQWLYLTCDLPAPPLYPDELRENIIPQVPFATLLAKFNGVTEKEYKTYKDNTIKCFQLTHLPPFIICYFKRFTKNYFVSEKNPTIVNFPIKNIDFGELLSPEVRATHRHTTYDLVANIVHDSEPGGGQGGTYRCHVLHKATGKWYEMQDLHVADILPQMITLSESYIQIYEVREDIPNPFYQPLSARASKQQQEVMEGTGRDDVDVPIETEEPMTDINEIPKEDSREQTDS